MHSSKQNSLIFKKLIEDNHKEVLAELAKFDILSEEGLRRFLQRVDPQAVEKAERPVDMNLDPGSAVKKRTFSAMETEDSDLRKNSGHFLNQYSHCPSQAVHRCVDAVSILVLVMTDISARAMGMLDAGFDPKKNIYFASLLLDIMKSSDGKCSGKDIAIPCKHSTNLIVVPDPVSKLDQTFIMLESHLFFSDGNAQTRGDLFSELHSIQSSDPKRPKVEHSRKAMSSYSRWVYAFG